MTTAKTRFDRLLTAVLLITIFLAVSSMDYVDVVVK